MMRRCIDLARLGAGNVSPNPMVGAVVVCNGRIIGEGYHRKYGGPHAEVNAINSVRDEALLPRSEIYVSLEPCAHFGKTPPCADLIISKKIRKVYVGCLDPFTKVDGKGIRKLRDAGIEVEVGILEKECQELNRRFFTSVNFNRPYVILKWAQSLDGFIDKDFAPVRISNHRTEILNHKWRSEEDAILVGYNTVRRDNPSLTNRLWAGKNPLRVVIDRDSALEHDKYKVFDDSARTVVLSDTDPRQILSALHEMKVQSVIVEGGAATHKKFVDAGLWDEARVFVSTQTLGNGTRAVALTGGRLVGAENVCGDTLMTYYSSTT